MGDIKNGNNYDRLRHRCAIRKKVRSSQEEDNPVPATVVDTTADALKVAFTKGNVPAEKDFLSLIDLADVGRKAAGLDNANDKSGQGLELVNDILQVKADPDGGITVSAAGVSIVGSDTITLGSAGAAVIPDTTKGITTGVGGVEIIPNMDEGMQVTTTGIGVITHDGIGVSTDGIGIDADSDKSVEVSATGVGVVAGDGVSVGAGTVAVAPNLAQGVLVSSSGVEVNYGRGLAIENDQLVVVNQTTIGGAFPTSPVAGDIHYKLVGDDWAMLAPHGLNSGLDESIGRYTGGNVFADGDNLMVTFRAGWISTSTDKGRTWVGLRLTIYDTHFIRSADLHYGLGACAIETLSDDPIESYVSYNAGRSWIRIPTLGSDIYSYHTIRICGSRLFAGGQYIGGRINDDQGVSRLVGDPRWNLLLGPGAFPGSISVHDRTVWSIGNMDGHIVISDDAGYTWRTRIVKAGIDTVFNSAALNNNGQCIVREGENTLYLYDDSTGTVTKVADGLDPLHYSQSISCTAAFEDKLYAAGGTRNKIHIYESIDGGLNFKAMENIPSTTHAITGMVRTKECFLFIDENNDVYGSFAGKYVYYDSVWNLS